jgi:hypothetical protein
MVTSLPVTSRVSQQALLLLLLVEQLLSLSSVLT